MQINTPTTQIHERSLGLVQITFMLINYRLYLQIVLKVTTSKSYNNITYPASSLCQVKREQNKEKDKIIDDDHEIHRKRQDISKCNLSNNNNSHICLQLM